MNDRLAFLRAIRAEPDDDTARLAFADWLDEHDDPLGAFIRIQIELEPIRDRLEDLHVRRLIEREEQFEPAHDPALGAAFECDRFLRHPEGIGFRRGLPEWACVSLDTLLKSGERLIEAYPTIRELAVFDIEGRGDQLAGCELLTRVDTLEVADQLTPADVRALAASPYLRSVPKFVLWGGWSSELGEALAEHATAEWPWQIDVLWIEDGLAIGIDAVNCDEPLDPNESYAWPMNHAAGRILALDVQPARRLFPLRGWNMSAMTTEAELELGIDSGHGLYYGRLPDDTQAILATQDGPWLLARFRDSGHLIGVEERPAPFTNWDAITYEDMLARVLADYQLTPAVLRVREFRSDPDFGIHLWPNSFVNQFYSGTRHPQLAEARWRERGGEICRWLRNGDFVIDWGNNFWADWRGTIHSS